jgi:hypothetical protein
MNPTIPHGNDPPSGLQDAVKAVRLYKDVAFTWTDCEMPLSAFTCVADRISEEMPQIKLYRPKIEQTSEGEHL